MAREENECLSCQKALVSLAAAALPPPVHFKSLRMADDQLHCIKNKHVKKFYKNQNEMIERFLQVDQVIEALKHGVRVSDYGSIDFNAVGDEESPFEEATARSSLLPRSSEEKSPLWVIHLAINLSFLANVTLFISKVVLAYFSGSMAILASAFESFLDIVSNAIIFFTVRIIRQKDYYTYPVGKSRMEPLGIVVFACMITTSFTQVLVTSVERLADGGPAEPLDLSIPALSLLTVNVIVKAILWVWCARIKGSSSVTALAYDHENDVVFTIASTLFPLVGNYAKLPWLDPLGAIILSIYIIYEWMRILMDNIKRLTGKAASTEDLKQLTYMAYRFSTKIQAVDTVRAYYNGDRLLVEIDIILPPECPLHEAHDVGEALQDALELLDNVERAFVHLDYNAHHEAEHRRVVDGVGFGG
ncbi:hypothetical protein DM01DRAFT_1410782 [Hesseltinella vesiculosa]|uniref:Uncharacterized protein n=1 Tax=Hesseltinella vesiculosa TaxID=101127 RepID=A0A1X2G6F2_9FUNG|nr:hypothetical protein DM01DRAFT_1410782 [Hesseltinella vesiculosa]